MSEGRIDAELLLLRIAQGEVRARAALREGLQKAGVVLERATLTVSSRGQSPLERARGSSTGQSPLELDKEANK